MAPQLQCRISTSLTDVTENPNDVLNQGVERPAQLILGRARRRYPSEFRL